MSWHSHVSFLRRLAPAGGFPSLPAILNAWKVLRQTGSDRADSLAKWAGVFQNSLSVQTVLPAASGKEALFLVFREAVQTDARRYLLLAGYTCPDIVAAGVRAGLQIVPVDMDQTTLEMLPASVPDGIPPETAMVVLSNLYGIPDRIEPWRARFGSDLLIVDDGCQALLSRDQGDPIGTRRDTVGVVSFGRGKALCGIGGGAVVLSAHSHGRVAEALRLAAEAKEARSRIARGVNPGDWLKLLLFWLFEHPVLFGIPEALPFLHLGETRYERDFKTGDISFAQMLVAAAQVLEADAERAIRADRCSRWGAALQGLPAALPAEIRRRAGDQLAPTRFPVVLPDASVRQRVLRLLQHAGLGASRSYPAPLEMFCEGEPLFCRQLTPGAAVAATRILTLPTHRYVEAEDIARAVQVLRSEIGRGGI